MKKFFLSLTVFAASAVYAAYQYAGGNDAVSTAQATSNASAPIPQQTEAPATPAPAPAPKPKGQYVDGKYMGSAVYVYYGTVQVEAIVQGGKLTDVTFLQYPNDRSTSRYINSQAMPLLRQEALQAQNADVSGVSGASHTSGGFSESLANALAQAKS